MKIFTKKGFIQKISIILLFLVIFNFTYPNIAHADGEEDIGGILLSPAVKLVTGISDAAIHLAQLIILRTGRNFLYIFR